MDSKPASDPAKQEPASHPDPAATLRARTFLRSAWTRLLRASESDVIYKRGKFGTLIFGTGATCFWGADYLLHRYNLVRPTEAKTADLFRIKEGMDKVAAEKAAAEVGKDPVFTVKDLVVAEKDLVVAEKDLVVAEKDTVVTGKDPVAVAGDRDMPYEQASDYIMHHFNDLYKSRVEVMKFFKNLF